MKGLAGEQSALASVAKSLVERRGGRIGEKSVVLILRKKPIGAAHL
jgi:hypothetical protein